MAPNAEKSQRVQNRRMVLVPGPRDPAAPHLIANDRQTRGGVELHVGLHDVRAIAIEHDTTGATAMRPSPRGRMWSLQTFAT